MAECRELFRGKVVIRALASTEDPRNRTEILARLLSPRGEMAVLNDGTIAIRHLAYLELRPCVARGNHFHEQRHERFYVISGRIELHLADTQSGEFAVALLQTGDLALIPPRIAHAFLPLESGHALEFSPEPFDAADVHPFAASRS